MSLIALDKWAKLVKIISQNGGLIKSFYKLWRFDALKLLCFGVSANGLSVPIDILLPCLVIVSMFDGTLVGTDCLGNKYYENTYYMLGSSRWVEYSDCVKWDYDASQVPPQWFGWLHYKTDCLPHDDLAKYCLSCSCYHRRWLLPPEENMSGTEFAFYPYSTVRQHIKAWDGKSICSRPPTCR